ncbi:MAG: phosphate acyltransferase [Candidatus Marinimicrobia bacterium]|nr:phosphate acyltransferase [Candidatus Neomarinimicrobiota bacterium]
MTPLEKIRERAVNDTNVNVVLPEGKDARICKAAAEITEQKIARVTVLGKEEEILKAASESGVFLDDVEVFDPMHDPDFENYVSDYYELRIKKGMTMERAREIMGDPTFFSAMMLRKDRADICISGALNPTAHVLRAGLQIVRTGAGDLRNVKRHADVLAGRPPAAVLCRLRRQSGSQCRAACGDRLYDGTDPSVDL